MKKIIKYCLVTLVFLGISSLSAETIKVGTNANYPPFEYIDENSHIAGFDIDLVDELSKKVGFKYEIVNMGFDGLIPALKSGKIDIIAAGMSATPARKKAVDFSDSYYVTENLFIKQKSNSDINSKDDLRDKSIGVQLGTVQEQAARKLNKVNVFAVEDIFAAIMALKNGKIDAVLVDSSVGYGYLRKNDDIVEFHKEPDGSEGFSLAFDKNKHTELISKINLVIEELRNDGTYDSLLDKYELKK
ncbi:amino acid ABC transporter, periplasmic arginine/lysine/histidine-binding protein [Campylobacter blaseri]|uniref:Basic amino acid ABC transporter substrate-binding protein n=1 Tax=Campylobacter blaseri TaxID=2042961 RepID=A0A2P8R0Q7_9BACT|nr:basic amino acid ABC transporter substrate-binding protein [Campylobacter blaseri]PSM52069.1 basic amino acid ABC transporter substrate-binding protein [Campylobacter blaseri]PSM53854.1 basic amino acid ABC transporter substrate-binding protein [Campylobacter blaseri]QKF85591.1 amino acid ABC transporter, periplasmic arginine/lysine/histidine-binding protein [Campylobacter blaseri]